MLIPKASFPLTSRQRFRKEPVYQKLTRAGMILWRRHLAGGFLSSTICQKAAVSTS
jgi:hypothetical protein